MIKLQKKTIRETTAVIEVNDDDGKIVTEELRVKYVTPRIPQIKALEAEIEAAEKEEGARSYWLSRILAQRIHSIPDIADEDGKPLEISQEMLEIYFDIKNLTAIRDAIEEDLAGKSQSAK